MSDAVQYRIGRASETEIAAHLRACDGSFVPPLSVAPPLHAIVTAPPSGGSTITVGFGDRPAGQVSVISAVQRNM